MAPPRRRWRPHPPGSLRGRLGAVLVVVLTVGLAAAAVTIALVVRNVLLDRLDGELRAAGDRFAVGLEYSDGDADNRGGYGEVEGQAAGTLGARLLDGRVTDAAIVGEHDTAGSVPASTRRRLATLTLDPAPHTVELPGVGQYRITVTAGRDGDLQVTGLPTEAIEETTDKLVLVVVAVFAATLLVIVAVATGLLRVMLRPLTRMSSTALEVAGLPLAEGSVELSQRATTGTGGREIDNLAVAFNAMLEQLERALRTRADSEQRLRRFVADASHELRTPVAVVRSHAELARREGGGMLPAAVDGSLLRIGAQSERMGRLVDDLLLLARLDAGRPPVREPVDVVRLTLEATDDARIAHPGHQWRLRLPEAELRVPGDPRALQQVVANLLTNAAVHTPDGTTVSVGIIGDTTEAAADSVRLEVADDGPGMPDDVADHAFDRFVRGPGDRSDVGGSSGLGLSIVAAIVAAHDGSVSLTSDVTGTTVSVVLPAG